MKQTIKVNLAERKALTDVQSNIKNLEGYFANLVADIVTSRINQKLVGKDYEVSRDLTIITYEDSIEEDQNGTDEKNATEGNSTENTK